MDIVVISLLCISTLYITRIFRNHCGALKMRSLEANFTQAALPGPGQSGYPRGLKKKKVMFCIHTCGYCTESKGVS